MHGVNGESGLVERAEVWMIEKNIKHMNILQGNEKCSNSPETG